MEPWNDSAKMFCLFIWDDDALEILISIINNGLSEVVGKQYQWLNDFFNGYDSLQILQAFENFAYHRYKKDKNISESTYQYSNSEKDLWSEWYQELEDIELNYQKKERALNEWETKITSQKIANEKTEEDYERERAYIRAMSETNMLLYKLNKENRNRPKDGVFSIPDNAFINTKDIDNEGNSTKSSFGEAKTLEEAIQQTNELLEKLNNENGGNFLVPQDGPIVAKPISIEDDSNPEVIYTIPEERVQEALAGKQVLFDALNQQEIENDTLMDEYHAGREAEQAEKRERTAEEEIMAVRAKTDAMMAAYNTLYSGISELMGAQAANSEVMAVFSKSLALFDIGVNTAKAISSATASAKGITAFDYALQVAAAVGTVLSNVAHAKKLLSGEKTPKAPKMATGGLVRGFGSATSDSIPTWLSNGESVLNARATSMFGPILSSFNQLGGGVPFSTSQVSSQVMGEDMLVQAFSRALQQMPAPVVSVEEINNTNDRIKVLERYGSL